MGHRRVQFDRSVIAEPLEERLQAEESRDRPQPVRVIFDLNPDFPQGLTGAARTVRGLLKQAALDPRWSDGVHEPRLAESIAAPYLVAVMPPAALRWVVQSDLERVPADDWSLRAIRQVWPDFEVQPLLEKSVATVKGDAARASFAAQGSDIVWAVIDSGVDERHQHFARWGNLKVTTPLEHRDFTESGRPGWALIDDFGIGHGTAVAGVIAGEIVPDPARQDRPDFYRQLKVRRTLLDGDKTLDGHNSQLVRVCGVAPECKIVSFKVFGASAPSNVSAVMAALEHVQRVNDYGRNIRIHGVNLSLGYSFDPEWFVGGYSPLCSEVDRLVKSGVVVVAAAGNSGFVRHDLRHLNVPDEFSALVTINDPGNASEAITVGSTHRDSPHRYGVSYFSSKGPTGDGRLKPDLVAPGERIVSCVSSRGHAPEGEEWDNPDYTEFSGTSMAAAHVSGAVAAFLSVRREFIGRPERVKEIFLAAATDLGRVREFQGHGLVDVMRALQSV
jgi:serine protease AprX